jgi:hypothetical protein
VKPLGRIPVKGLVEPPEAYELTGAGPARTRLEASRARGLTRFVGRDSEMDQLRRAAEEIRRGHGQLVAVVGEPGVGKSRLYYEFIHSHHTHGWLTLASGSVSYGKAAAYLPLANLLRHYFRIESRDDVRAIRAKVNELTAATRRDRNQECRAKASNTATEGATHGSRVLLLRVAPQFGLACGDVDASRESYWGVSVNSGARRCPRPGWVSSGADVSQLGR